MQPLWDERYQPADAEIVKNKARKMMKRRTLREHQLEDVVQEMAMPTLGGCWLARLWEMSDGEIRGDAVAWDVWGLSGECTNAADHQETVASDPHG